MQILNLMRLDRGILSLAVVLPAVASPIPAVHTSTDYSQNQNVGLKPQQSSLGTTLANFGIAAVSTALIICSGIGVTEWALNFYSRVLYDRQDREQRSQTFADERNHREEQWARRERAMDLILEMAENYSDQVGSAEGFDGNFEPLKVPSSIVGVIENVFEQTSEERGPRRMESLDALKGTLKPILDLEKKAKGNAESPLD